MTDESHAKMDDPVGDSADVHQVSGQDESRDAEDDERVDAGKHPFRDNAERDVGSGDVNERGKAKGKRDGHP